MKTAEEFAKEIYCKEDGVDLSEINIPLSSAIVLMNQYVTYCNTVKQ